jgi:hypothetical protein
LLAIARSCADAQSIDNKESTDAKRDQEVGYNMQHENILGSYSQHGTEK